MLVEVVMVLEEEVEKWVVIILLCKLWVQDQDETLA